MDVTGVCHPGRRQGGRGEDGNRRVADASRTPTHHTPRYTHRRPLQPRGPGGRRSHGGAGAARRGGRGAAGARGGGGRRSEAAAGRCCRAASWLIAPRGGAGGGRPGGSAAPSPRGPCPGVRGRGRRGARAGGGGWKQAAAHSGTRPSGSSRHRYGRPLPQREGGQAGTGARAPSSSTPPPPAASQPPTPRQAHARRPRPTAGARDGAGPRGRCPLCCRRWRGTATHPGGAGRGAAPFPRVAPRVTPSSPAGEGRQSAA